MAGYRYGIGNDWWKTSDNSVGVTANPNSGQVGSPQSGGGGGMGIGWGQILSMVGNTMGSVAGTIVDVKNIKNASTYNAGEYLKAAQRARQDGSESAADVINATNKMIETGKTVTAASGIENSGTSQQLTSDVAAMGEIDANRIRAQAEREAQKYTQAAYMEIAKIAQARKSGQRRIVSSMLSGGMMQLN